MAHRRGPTTERLWLRAFEPRDAAAFLRLNGDPDVMRYTGEPPVTSLQVAREAIERYPDWEQHGYGRWACVLRSEGPDSEPIGLCGLKFLDDRREVDLGYRFLPAYWGRGLATESGRASIDFGFETLGLPAISAFVLADNAGSIRVLHKLGMTREQDVDYDGEVAQRWVVTRDAWERR